MNSLLYSSSIFVFLLAADPSKLSLAERVRLFNGLSDQQQQRSVVSRPPRAAQQAAAAARRGRRRMNRFQTQPITVDEVEKARRGFLASYQESHVLQLLVTVLQLLVTSVTPVSYTSYCC